jgi:exopolysaccharide biosynthesis predicted pyruvyltransferase EpsI
VVWKRTKDTTFFTDNGAERKSVEQELPFLNMTRSLGDLWSFESATREHVVPDFN